MLLLKARNSQQVEKKMDSTDYSVTFKDASGDTVIRYKGHITDQFGHRVSISFRKAARVGAEHLILKAALSGGKIPEIASVEITCSEGKREFTQDEFVSFAINGPEVTI
jgi:hypothetical protein